MTIDDLRTAPAAQLTCPRITYEVTPSLDRAGGLWDAIMWIEHPPTPDEPEPRTYAERVGIYPSERAAREACRKDSKDQVVAANRIGEKWVVICDL